MVILVVVVRQKFDCDKIELQESYQTVDAVLMKYGRRRTSVDTGLDRACYTSWRKG